MALDDITRHRVPTLLLAWLIGSLLGVAVIAAIDRGHLSPALFRIVVPVFILLGLTGTVINRERSLAIECASRALFLAGFGIGLMKAVESASSWLSVVIFVAMTAIAKGIADRLAQRKTPQIPSPQPQS
jgi:uncharacterized membrane protein YfcA